MPKRLRSLDCIQKRDLLASDKASAEELREHAKSFLDDGLLIDAFNFYAKIKDKEGLEACKAAAFETADHDLLWKLAHSRMVEVSDADWRACAERAIELGKHRIAAYIFERLEDWDGFSRLPKELDPRVEEEAS